MKNNRFNFAVLMFALITAFLLSSSAWAQKGKGGGGGKPSGGGPSYQIIELDNAGGMFVDTVALDVNNLGEIVGQAEVAATYSAVYWTIDSAGGTTTSAINLLANGPADSLSAHDINDYSEIVGTGTDASGDDFGLYWASPTAEPITLLPLPGDDLSWASGINNDGVVVGNSALQLYDQNGDPAGRDVSAVAWRVVFDQGSQSITVSGPVRFPDLAGDNGNPEAINDNDAEGNATAVGVVESADGSTQTAVHWTVTSNADGTLTADSAVNVLDINASARGVNNADTISGHIGDAPVIWTSGSSQTLNRAKFFFDTIALDINANGVIVGRGWYRKRSEIGFRAVVWPSAGGSMIELNKFLSSNSPFLTLQSSKAINDLDEIVGYGWDGNNLRAFLAIPD